MEYQLAHIGKIVGLYTTPHADDFVTELRDRLEFSGEGIPNDRHAGFMRLSGGREKKQYPKGTEIRNNRQWSAVSVEEMAEVAKSMGLEKVHPEWLGANLLVSGIPHWSDIPPMALLKIFQADAEGSVLVNYGQNKPCLHPHKAMETALGQKLDVPFTKAAVQTRGLVGWVEKPGIAYVGDRLEVWTLK